MVQLREFSSQPFDKILGLAMRGALEVSGIMNSINKKKNIPKALLDARCSLVNNKINIKYSS